MWTSLLAQRDIEIRLMDGITSALSVDRWIAVKVKVGESSWSAQRYFMNQVLWIVSIIRIQYSLIIDKILHLLISSFLTQH